jgi:Mrp family chromosome partitioning ATPase
MIKELAQAYSSEFHRLQSELFPEDKSAGGRIIQITSSHFGEGVTSTTLALAASMAEGPRREYGVIVVEANLRSPSMNSVLNIGQGGSLARVMQNPDNLWSNVQTVDAYGMAILPAGTASDVADGGDLEANLKNLGETLQRLKGKYRYILVDSPPVIPFRDSSIIATVTDGVVYVVEAELTRSQVVGFGIQKLAAVQAKILGMVLNKREFHIPRWLYRYL